MAHTIPEAITPLDLNGSYLGPPGLGALSISASPSPTPPSSVLGSTPNTMAVNTELRAKSRARKYILTAPDVEIKKLLQERLQKESEALGVGITPANHGNGEVSEKTKQQRIRLRDILFTSRFSQFDRQNPDNSDSPFFGFFTLFWLGMALLLLKVAAQNYRLTGNPLGGAEMFHIMFERDIIVIALTDGVMVASTIFSLFLQIAVKNKYLSWRRTGWIIQNIWQTVFLGFILVWMWLRDWPWTHTIFMVLHTLVFVMKQHSFAFYNGYLSQLSRRKEILEQKIKELDDIETVNETATSVAVATGIDTSTHPSSSDANIRLSRPKLGSRTVTDPQTEDNSRIGAIMNVIDHGNEGVDEATVQIFREVIHSELQAIDSELNGKAKDPTKRYPHNLTLSNFADYSVLPTLVYELEYPRRDHIDWWYVGEKSAAALGGIWIMIIVSQTFIYPCVLNTFYMKESGVPLNARLAEFPWVVSDLLFPILLEQLLTWYVIWECVLNVLAELTLFADRDFYGRWWNCVSWDQYARDWNRPVHDFLLRHVYNSSISSFHLSKQSATFVTFLLSALVHELLMWCLFKKVRGYLFLMQLMQIPLASLSRTRLLKGRKLLGNLVFWIGLFVGPSILASLYLIV